MSTGHRSQAFEVPGIPQPQGSKKAFVIRDKATHKARAVVVDDNRAKLRDYRAALADAARQAWGDEVHRGPLYLTVTFRLCRPKSHYGKAGNVLTSAPAIPQTKPDVDKLLRAVLDALTGIVYADDAQVAFVVGRKVYSETAATRVHVETIEDAT